jgi:hypothetical protein
MLINEQNGRIDLAPNLILYPQLSLDKLASKDDFNLWQEIAKTVNRHCFQLFRQTFVDYLTRRINVDLNFKDEILWAIELSYFLDSEEDKRLRENNYPNVRTEREAYHLNILRNELGSPPLRYIWGYISCEYI